VDRVQVGGGRVTPQQLRDARAEKRKHEEKLDGLELALEELEDSEFIDPNTRTKKEASIREQILTTQKVHEVSAAKYNWLLSAQQKSPDTKTKEKEYNLSVKENKVYQLEKQDPTSSEIPQLKQEIMTLQKELNLEVPVPS